MFVKLPCHPPAGGQQQTAYVMPEAFMGVISSPRGATVLLMSSTSIETPLSCEQVLDLFAMLPHQQTKRDRNET
jgi:hypothetical protein